MGGARDRSDTVVLYGVEPACFRRRLGRGGDDRRDAGTVIPAVAARRAARSARLRRTIPQSPVEQVQARSAPTARSTPTQRGPFTPWPQRRQRRRRDARLGRRHLDSRGRATPGEGRIRSDRAGSLRALRRAERRRSDGLYASSVRTRSASSRASTTATFAPQRSGSGEVSGHEGRHHGILHGRTHRARRSDRQWRHLFAAACPFYGPSTAIDPQAIHIPICGSYGARDTSIPAE